MAVEDEQGLTVRPIAPNALDEMWTRAHRRIRDAICSAAFGPVEQPRTALTYDMIVEARNALRDVPRFGPGVHEHEAHTPEQLQAMFEEGLELVEIRRDMMDDEACKTDHTQAIDQISNILFVLRSEDTFLADQLRKALHAMGEGT